MRQFFVAALAALALALPARADSILVSRDVSSAAGSLVDTGAQNFGGAGSATCIVTNGSAAARNFNVLFLSDDKTATLWMVTTSVPASSTAAFFVGGGAYATPGMTPIGIAPTRWMQFTLSAGGAGTARVTCFGRG